MNRRTGPARMRLPVLAGFSLSALLIAMLGMTYPEVVASLGSTLSSARPWGLAGVLAATFLHCAITAHKWRLVTEAGGRGSGIARAHYLGHTAFIALAGQIMPQQVAVVIGRGLVLRMQAQVPVRRGVLGALYDQGLDLLVPVLAVVPGVLFFTGATGPGLALALFGVSVGGLGMLLAWFGARGADIALAAVGTVLGERLAARIAKLREAAPLYLSRAFVLRMYGWSVVRFANLVLRAWLAAWAIGLDLRPAALLFGHAAVSFAALLNFVPGSLGVAEWGWVSLLDLAGYQAEDAATFALSHRLLVVAALLVLSVLFALGLPALRRRGGRGVEKNAS